MSQLSPAWRFALALLPIVSSCSDLPTREGPQHDVHFIETIRISPEQRFSGDTLTIAVRAVNESQIPVAHVELQVIATRGSVLTPGVVTDADGEAEVRWVLADEESPQKLRYVSGSGEGGVELNTKPRIVGIAAAAPSSLLLGTDAVVDVRGVTNTGRTVPYTAPYTINVAETHPLHPEFPVLRVTGSSVTAIGPGASTLRVFSQLPVSNFFVASEPFAISVAPGAVVTGIEGDSLPQSGGTITIRGRDLDKLPPNAVLADGVPGTTTSATYDALTVSLPAASTECAGRDAVSIVVRGALSTMGELLMRRARDQTLDMKVGELRQLGRGDVCVRLPGIAGAEYAIGYFDVAAIEGARHSAERSLAFEPFELRVTDRSIAGPVVSTSTRAVVRMTQQPRPSDVVQPAIVTGATATSWYDRQAPWAVGDTFTIASSLAMQGGRARVFAVVDKFAVATMERDSAYHIPQRVEGLHGALTAFSSHADVLQTAFGVDWPSTSAGAGQTLVMIGDFFAGGFLSPGTGLVNRGTYIGLDPGVGQIPLAQPLYIDDFVVFHELVHAFQDRYMMKRCIASNDCANDGWDHRWAVEGGADFLAEEIARRENGLSLSGNGYPITPSALAFLGGSTPHYIFTEGYRSSAWFLRSLLARAVASGHSPERAAGEVAIGALEGWYGHGAIKRTGLRDRMQALFGSAWEPADAVIRATLSIAADDRTANPELQEVSVHQVWRHFVPAASFALGSGLDVSITGNGATFAHYLAQDSKGLGGTLKISSPATAVWAVVRTR